MSSSTTNMKLMAAVGAAIAALSMLAAAQTTSRPAPPSPYIHTDQPYRGLKVPDGDLHGTYSHLHMPPAVQPSSANALNNINVINLAYAGAGGINIHFQTPANLAGAPTIKWGSSATSLTNTATGTTRTYNRTPPCSAEPVTECSQYFHDVQITGLASGITYYYQIVGDASGTTSSDVLQFKTAHAAGSTQPYSVNVICDMGYTFAQGTYNQIVSSLGSTDFTWHGGDISYADDWVDGIVPCSAGYDCAPANGTQPAHEGSGNRGGDVDSQYERSWDEWQQWFNGVAAYQPHMVMPGNHEAACVEFDGSSPYPVAAELNENSTSGDITNLADRYLTYYSCPPSQRNFTAFAHRFRMPSQESGAAVNNYNSNFWYSFDSGLVHYISLNGETDYPTSPEFTLPRELNRTYETDSGPFGNAQERGGLSTNPQDYDQIQWLQRDLAAVNRTKTPWVVAMSHRPMYTSAVSNPPNGGATSYEHNVRASFEPIFHKFGVDAYFSGHIHLYDRLYPIYNNTVDSNAVIDKNTYISNGKSTTYVVQGMAGNIENHSTGTQNTQYSAVFNQQDFGLGRLNIVNSTHLVYQFVKGSDGSIGDQFTLIKPSFFGSTPATIAPNTLSPFTTAPATTATTPIATNRSIAGEFPTTVAATTAPHTTRPATTSPSSQIVVPVIGSGPSPTPQSSVTATAATTTRPATTAPSTGQSVISSGNNPTAAVSGTTTTTSATTRSATTAAATTAAPTTRAASSAAAVSSATAPVQGTATTTLTTTKASTTAPTTRAATAAPTTRAATTAPASQLVVPSAGTGPSPTPQSSVTATAAATTRAATSAPTTAPATGQSVVIGGTSTSKPSNSSATSKPAAAANVIRATGSSGLAVCNVIDPTRKEAPWAGSNNAYPQYYDNSKYVCVDGNFLCPATAPLRCGYSCYVQGQYTCVNGLLRSGGGQ